jgi:anti-sigma regulatory factor (Ser/Thr protein kinase)
MDMPVLQPAGWASHSAAFYDGPAGLASSARAFLEHDAGSPALIAAPAPSLELLRILFGSTDQRLHWADMTAIGANPARIIPAIRAFADSHRGQTVRCLIEALWDGRSAAHHREAVRHEALVNYAFSDLPVIIMCAFDVALAGLAAVAELTHPVLIRDGTRCSSTGYDAGSVFPAGYDEPFEPVPGNAFVLAYEDNLSAARAFASEHARSAGIAAERVRDLIIAVGEIVANTHRHTRGGGVLSVWAADQELICQVRDSGHIADRLAGLHPPAPNGAGGLGLWVVHQLCDLVEIRTAPGSTCIRLHMWLDGDSLRSE